MGVEPRIGVIFPPKWMVYKNGKAYEQMDDLVVKNPIFGKHPYGRFTDEFIHVFI